MPQPGSLVSSATYYGGFVALDPMRLKTSFSFHLQFPAETLGSPPDRQLRMEGLEDQLRHAVLGRDAAAVLVGSDNHRGAGNRIVELTTTLQDTDVEAILQAFTSQTKVRVTPVE